MLTDEEIDQLEADEKAWEEHSRIMEELKEECSRMIDEPRKEMQNA